MSQPWMLMTGCAMFGYLLPEVLLIYRDVRVPVMMNLLSSLAAFLVSGSFVV